jgi:hypothetical protein
LTAGEAAGLEADYVIVGAGLTGLAFADEILSRSDASMIVVDRRPHPGGHWNEAYDFLRLHSPGFTYGVNGLPLGTTHIETEGLNRGHFDLSTGREVCAYLRQVMSERLLPSGRVTFLPLSDYADGVATHRVTGTRTQLSARRKVVEAGRLATELPLTHPPRFPVASSVSLIPPNELSRRVSPEVAGYVVIGAGKTAMDAAAWLLAQGLDPARITWIRPRDAWFYNRRNLQPHRDVAVDTLSGMSAALEAAAGSSTLAELFVRLEAAHALLRLDPAVMPTMFRCATITQAERDELARVTNVVRLGHVTAIDPDRIRLEQGEIPTSSAHLHINCTADGIPVRELEPVYQPGRIVMQLVNHCSPCSSAAFIAFIEATRTDDEQKNGLVRPAPMAQRPEDWLRLRLSDARNAATWTPHADIAAWFEAARIDGYSRMIAEIERSPTPASKAALDRFRLARAAALPRMAELAAAALQEP